MARRMRSSTASSPANSATLRTTNTVVPVRIAGRAELPVAWPPASQIQAAAPPARPSTWVPMLKVSLCGGLRWARSYRA